MDRKKERESEKEEYREREEKKEERWDDAVLAILHQRRFTSLAKCFIGSARARLSPTVVAIPSRSSDII